MTDLLSRDRVLLTTAPNTVVAYHQAAIYFNANPDHVVVVVDYRISRFQVYRGGRVRVDRLLTSEDDLTRYLIGSLGLRINVPTNP